MTRLLLPLAFVRQDKNQRIENGEEQEANSEPDSGPVKGKDEIIGNCDFASPGTYAMYCSFGNVLITGLLVVFWFRIQKAQRSWLNDIREFSSEIPTT